MEPVTVPVYFTEKDFIRLNFLMSYRNPLLLASTAIGLFMAVYTACTFNNERAPLNNEFGIATSSLILFFYPVRIWLRSRKMFRKAPKVPDLIYTFDAEGFKVSGKNRDLSQSWKQVHSVREIGKWYMIYIRPGQAHYIPANCFSSPDREAAFRELVWRTGRPAKWK